MLKKLRYGNTNTFFIKGVNSGLLIDTDYAGTLPAFFRAIKSAGIDLRNITYVLATHYHPDHIGIVGELQRHGVKLVLVDVQKKCVHFSDHIFSKDQHMHYTPINENTAVIISCEESRAFLKRIGIDGEMIHTPSHSEDSISVILDDGDCIVGDLEPISYVDAYDNNIALREDWEKVKSFQPVRIFYAHANEKHF